jgi:type IV secretion system protein VirB2
MVKTTTKSAQSMIDMCWHLLVLVAVFVGASVFSDAAMAAAPAGDSNAIEQVFCNVVLILTGTTGKAIATVAVIAVGVGALLGKISWGMALIVALGVALIFGAASIVSSLGGTGNSCAAGSILST